MTLLICSECGVGHYALARLVADPAPWACTHCDHRISDGDLEPDSDERIMLIGGRLAVVAVSA